MAQPKPAALSGLLVSKRTASPGAAAPVSRAALVSLQAGSEPAGPYYKALTLKVDQARYTRLKALGIRRNQRSQALLTEALDLLFARYQS